MKLKMWVSTQIAQSLISVMGPPADDSGKDLLATDALSIALRVIQANGEDPEAKI